MIRVLIADDSQSARALLAGMLSADPEFTIVGEARDGREAVALACRLKPDIVTLDLDMPGLDGFEATRQIMTAVPTPIVIVSALAGLSEAEAAAGALGAGALAVLRKPAGPGAPGFERSRRDIVATVKAMADVKVVRRWPERPMEAPPPALPSTARPPATVVAIATSTGGPPALHHLFGELSADFPAPILVVQHISRGFTEGFASWLGRGTKLRVKLAEDGETASRGTAYVAPDDRHLGIERDGTIRHSSKPAIGGFRPSATFLFESAAAAFGSRAVAVILTGMGRDGVDGLRAIRRAGAQTIAQDEKTSVIFGMPGAAVAEGLADVVLPLTEIAGRLVHLTVTGRADRTRS
jgi:two-component system chemotaxis response regulator CheB